MIHFILKFATISLIYKIKESIKIFSFVVKFLIIFMIEDGFSIVAILGRVCTSTTTLLVNWYLVG